MVTEMFGHIILYLAENTASTPLLHIAIDDLSVPGRSFLGSLGTAKQLAFSNENNSTADLLLSVMGLSGDLNAA